MKNRPTILAKVAETSSHRKSVMAAPLAPVARFCLTLLASNGAWNELDVLETRVKILNNDSEIAIRRVRVADMRTE